MIKIENCHANNLKNVSAEIPFGKVVALAGPSGSGKSSMAYNGLFLGEKCEVKNRPANVIYIAQRTASTTQKWQDFLAKTKDLPKKSLIITDELATGMTVGEAAAAAKALRGLAKDGHAVVIVEHRQEMIKNADLVFVFGPGSGASGGEIISKISGKQYAHGFKIPSVKRAANKSGKRIGANWQSFGGVKNFSIDFPIHKIVAVSGKMSTGKSRFIAAAFAATDKSAGAGERRGQIGQIVGKQYIRRPHLVTADPVCKNPRSTVATFYGIQKFLSDAEKKLTIDQLLKQSKDKLLLRRLAPIQNIGLGYLRADQPSFSLSGGECQRLKLAKMLCKKLGDRSLYIFDNPVRGLDMNGIQNIMMSFDALVKNNNSVLIAENDPTALQYTDEIIFID